MDRQNEYLDKGSSSQTFLITGTQSGQTHSELFPFSLSRSRTCQELCYTRRSARRSVSRSKQQMYISSGATCTVRPGPVSSPSFSNFPRRFEGPFRHSEVGERVRSCSKKKESFSTCVLSAVPRERLNSAGAESGIRGISHARTSTAPQIA